MPTHDQVEAASAGVMVVLTAWTIIILRDYAKDTKAIAKLTGEQVERSQRPFLILEFPGGLKGPTDHRDDGRIRNCGTGAALNINYKTPQSTVQSSRWPNPLPIDGEIAFKEIMPTRWSPVEGFSLEYDSMSGQRYRTLIRVTTDYQLKTEFEEIARLPSKDEEPKLLL